MNEDPVADYKISTSVGFGIIAIVLILVFGIGTYIQNSSHIEKSPVGAASGDIGTFNSALALYQVDVAGKQFPATTLMQLYSDNAFGWAGSYMATITKDPWNNQYTYTSDGTNYTIQSVHDSENDKSETVRYCFGTGVMESMP